MNTKTIYEQMRAGIATYGNESEEMTSLRCTISDMFDELQKRQSYISWAAKRIDNLRKEIEQGNERATVLNRTLIMLYRLYTDAITAAMKSVDDENVADVVRTIVAKG